MQFPMTKKFIGNQEVFPKYRSIKEIPKYLLFKDKTQDPKYKTELCKKFEETGKCPYGVKCRFAHGKEELKSLPININYKKKPCKSFLETGFCPYGYRCSFRHEAKNLSELIPLYHSVNLFIFDKIEPFEKRLPVFEEISKMAEEEKQQEEESTSDQGKILLTGTTPLRSSLTKTNETANNLSTSTLSNDSDIQTHEEYFYSPKKVTDTIQDLKEIKKNLTQILCQHDFEF